jgi:hypothetical protein
MKQPPGTLELFDLLPVKASLVASLWDIGYSFGATMSDSADNGVVAGVRLVDVQDAAV